MTPQAARAELETLSPEALGPILSRLAGCVPDSFFYSGDFPEDRILRGALFGLATTSLEAMGPDLEMSHAFTGLENASGPYGDWDVTITYTPIERACDPGTGSAEAALAALPAEELKGIVSDMACRTPLTVYIDRDFGKADVAKQDGSGEAIPLEAQYSMLLCGRLTGLSAGESSALTFDVYLKGETALRRFTVCAARKSLGDRAHDG